MIKSTSKTVEVFADKQLPYEWHVEVIDAKSGSVDQVLFTGPNAEVMARKFAEFQTFATKLPEGVCWMVPHYNDEEHK